MADPSAAGDRARIFEAMRAARASLTHPAAYPDYDIRISTSDTRLKPGVDPCSVFLMRAEEAGTRCFRRVAELTAALRHAGALTGYCDPALLDLFANGEAEGLELSGEFRRERMEDYAFSITAAHAAIAETGTIVLTDAGTSRRLAAVSPWIHVAVLDPKTVHGSLADGVQALPKDPNVVFVTGASCTADVEGILIRGAHGPAEQFCLIPDGLSK
jgi:L-lactate dehydrogenase complex protein LldG